MRDRSIGVQQESAARQHALDELWSSQESGSSATQALTEAGARCRRCERGSVSLLVLFMGLVMYALAAMTWNTGEVTVAKMEAQTAADSAAYSTAMWMSRGVNIIAATNMLALRDASALGVAVAMQFQAIWIPIMLAIHFVNTIVPMWAAIATIPAGIAAFAQLLVELAVYFTILGDLQGDWPGLVQPTFDAVTAGIHLDELITYQQAWVAAIPGIVETQRRQLENYYDCDITLVQGNGSSAIRAPLRRGDALTPLIPINLRYLYDAFAKGSWYSDKRMAAIVMGKAKLGYKIGAALGAVAANAAIIPTHHVLSSQPEWSPLEVGPSGWGFIDDPATWADFSVVAVARKRTSNVRSKQFPSEPLGFMAPGLYDRLEDIRPAAYAQAETFNAIDGLFPSIKIHGVQPLVILSNIYPWRVWTDWGWQWQPRLTHGTLLQSSGFDSAGVTLTPQGSRAAMH